LQKKNILNILEQRLFIVEKCDKETLLPTVKNEIELGIYIEMNG